MFSLGENTYTTQQREDSLLSLLKSSPAINEQIELYKDLATMYRQMPKEIVYLNKMADAIREKTNKPLAVVVIQDEGGIAYSFF